jgi:hypothetical protein
MQLCKIVSYLLCICTLFSDTVSTGNSDSSVEWLDDGE